MDKKVILEVFFILMFAHNFPQINYKDTLKSDVFFKSIIEIHRNLDLERIVNVLMD